MEDPLRLHVLPELRQPSLVLAFEGWNDAGESATTALSFLNDALHTAPLGEIDGEDFFDFTVRRPRIGTADGALRRIEWPRFELRYGALGNGSDVIVGFGDEPHVRWRHFTELVVSLVRRLRVRRVVLLGAFLADVLYSLPVRVTGFATRPEALAELGAEPSHYEGPTGIVGVLGSRLAEEGLEVTSLWAGLPHYIATTPNPRGALALVEVLSRSLGLELDDRPLRGSAREFEERVSAMVAADPELTEYVKQLKRREFAN